MDDILRRLGKVESDVSELKGDVKGILASLPSLATKESLESQVGGLRTEVASMETRIIKWMIATVLTASGVAFSVARFVH